MKVVIEEIRLTDDLVHIKYSTLNPNSGWISSRVRLPIAGFDEAWIPLAIKEDLAQRKESRAVFEKVYKTYIGQEVDIDIEEA